LNPDGSLTQHYPALSSGDRPVSRDDCLLNDARTSELDEWISQLAGAIAESLAQFRSSVKDQIVVFAVDCAPWNGSIALTFLTYSEVENDPMLADPTEMAGWKHYDFASDLAVGNSANSLFTQIRKDYEDTGEERAEVADSYLRACAAAVASEQVQEAL